MHLILLDKIFCPEEQRERANKALKLNGGTDYDPMLLVASSTKKKPTVRIKLSNIQRQLVEQQKKKAEKAL